MHYDMSNVTMMCYLLQPQILRQYIHSTTIYVNVTHTHSLFCVNVSPRKVQCLCAGQKSPGGSVLTCKQIYRHQEFMTSALRKQEMK